MNAIACEHADRIGAGTSGPSRWRARTVLLVMLVVALAGCAPGVRGTLSNRPLDIDFLDPESVVEVVPGHTFYVTNTSPYADLRYFGYSPEETNDLLGMSATRVGDSVTRNISREFTLVDVRAPDGWDISLYRVVATREIVDEDRQHGVMYFQDNVQPFFSIGVPADTRPGLVTRVFVTIEGRDDTSARIVLVVHVMEPEG